MSQPFEPIAMTMREVSERLQIGRTSAHRLVSSGALPGFRVGSSWRVLRRDFEAYIEQQRAEAEAAYQRARCAS
jgi:excisionase family DNA binding protein